MARYVHVQMWVHTSKSKLVFQIRQHFLNLSALIYKHYAFQISNNVQGASYVSSVYYGLPKTHSVFKMGHADTGTVVHFSTLQHTVVSQVCMGIIIRWALFYFIFSPLIIIYFI